MRIRRGGQGVRTPLRGDRGSGPPLKNHKNKGFSSNTGPDPLKKWQLPSQHSMLGRHLHASETPFNGVSLAGRWWPAYSGTWILPPLIKKRKMLSKLDPLWQNFLDPRMCFNIIRLECEKNMQTLCAVRGVSRLGQWRMFKWLSSESYFKLDQWRMFKWLSVKVISSWISEGCSNDWVVKVTSSWISEGCSNDWVVKVI